jgi:hypothetical protein
LTSIQRTIIFHSFVAAHGVRLPLARRGEAFH